MFKKKPAQDPEQGVNFRYRYTKENLSRLAEVSTAKDTLAELGGLEGLAAGVGSDVRHGLSKAEADAGYVDRIRQYGTNKMPEMSHKTIFQHWFEAVQDTTLLILCAAAVVSIVLQSVFEDPSHGWYEGTAILFAVTIVSCVTAGNNYSQESQFRSLNQTEINKRVKAIRAGEKVEILAFDIMVGDILLLEKGDLIPADGVVLESFALLVDESSMTGESDMIEKSPDHAPFMLSGCIVCDGIGRMMVTCTGPESVWGKAIAKLTQEYEDTPLQEKLSIMAGQIGKIGLGAAILTFSALTIFWAVRLYGEENQKFNFAQLIDLLDFFIISVTIVVVAVPEGLPLAVTISLAYSMKKMMLDNNLVRRLQACETMGGATNICSDKTGTLTTNQMTVLEGWVSGTRFLDPRAQNIPLSKGLEQLLGEAISVNSTAYLQKKGNTVQQVGNKTECAMLTFMEGFGCRYEAVRQAARVQRIYSFTSERKRMSTLVKNEGSYRIFTKGASEIVLGLCSHYITNELQLVPIDQAARRDLSAQIDEMAQKGLRTICIAFADHQAYEETWTEHPPEFDLICIALVGIKDPVRPEVPRAVAQCQRAGIVVRMVTGDNLATARFIARECGILTDGVAMEGSEFRALSDAQMDRILPRLQVLARSSPIDKHTLVKRLKENGEVVAVTGDGTNDAPALNEAHVGLAMGIAGTDVAKEASDIIILDDNFSSIVSAVMWGRCVFDNIRKFLQFQLTINLVALITAFLAAVTGRGLPLKTIQLLWVNLIMDSLAALALGTETPTPDLLDRKPYGAKERLISKVMMRNILCQGACQIAILLTLLYGGPKLFDLPYDNVPNATHVPTNKFILDTMIFNTFVFLQVFNEFNARIVTTGLNVFAGVFKNGIFVSIIVVTVILQALIVEFGGAFVETHPLTAPQWAVCVLLGFLSVPLGFLQRLLPVDSFSFSKSEEEEHLLSVSAK